MNGFRSATLWIIIVLVFFLAATNLTSNRREQISVVNLLNIIKHNPKSIIKATDKGGEIQGVYTKLEKEPGSNVPVAREVSFVTKYIPGAATEILKRMVEADIINYYAKPSSTLLTGFLISILLPLLLFFFLWFIIFRQIQGSGNKAMSFGKSKAKLVSDSANKVTFDDVAGVEEAKEELKEVVAFLKDPQKFSKLGGRIPKGVLLVGPPGTGKTLLARGVAGEASVPFFSLSGSDFVEMFVGVGASRVRDLFEQGKKNKPCIIFMDEIDAVGRHRFAGVGGGHDEREQTLNALLVEMDGFEGNDGVILIAATNRPDVLDPALLRPGRFDRQVTVDYPDLLGREKILAVHLKKVRAEQNVDLRKLAKATPGFSGADLANVVNEGALIAGRRNKDFVEMIDLEEARDRVMMGPERRSLAMNDRNKKIIAYHEAGHALCSRLTPGSDDVHKVTIVPRGRALGVTSYLPDKDVYHLEFRQDMLNKLISVMGGRAAEELIFEGDFTAGASGDIQSATRMAMQMVCSMGMSDRLGPRLYGEGNQQVFLGRDMARERNYSEDTAGAIDEEIKRILDEAHQKAQNLLRENKDKLDRIADALLERETIDGEELDLLIEGKELPPMPEGESLPPSDGGATDKPADEEEKTPSAKPSILDRPSEQPA
jgi:cell division protease FtsH